MSTKCSILWAKKSKKHNGFHLYFDYKDMGIHYEENGKEVKQTKEFAEFLRQVRDVCGLRDSVAVLKYFDKRTHKAFHKGE